MILDQYIDVPKDTWVLLPAGATGFTIVAKREREGAFGSYDNQNMKVEYCQSFDNSIPLADAPIAWTHEFDGHTDWYRYVEYRCRFNDIQHGFLQYFAWRDLDGIDDEPDFVRIYFSLCKRSKKMPGIASSGYITINKDSITTEALPSNASDLIVVVKNNSSQDSCTIDIRHCPFPGGVDETGATWSAGEHFDLNIENNVTTTAGKQYGGVYINDTDGILPYLDYQLESANSTEPEWVRVYYKLN